MKFGRVENPSLVDHQIPESFKWGSFEQKSAVSENGLTVYLGAPAWGDRGYIGKIYPPKTKPSASTWVAKPEVHAEVRVTS
jgi:hypothetical protein